MNAQTALEKETPLHFAARLGFTEIAKLLVQFNAELDPQLSSTGATPLHLAVSFNFLDIVALLVKSRADTNIRVVSGQTALLIAKEKNYTAMQELLSPQNLTKLEESENKKVSKQKIKTQGTPFKKQKHLTNTNFFPHLPWKDLI